MADALDLTALGSALRDAGAPWEMDDSTSMAQMTEAQRRRRLGFTPPPGEPPLEEAVRLDREGPDPRGEPAAPAAAPAAFDHRDVGGRDYTTAPKNQGGCGSCVAHAVASVMETTHRRARADAAFDLDLSEAHLFYCHGGEEGRTCQNGWWPDNALAKARDKGVTLESVYPYTGQQQACALSGDWRNNLAKVTGHTKLTGRAAIQEWIASRGSVTGCFVVYQDFFAYRSGVYRHVTGEQSGGHCVEIVGYDDAQGCWICKNSWGTNWGEGGYFRIAYGEGQIDSWAGPYGADGVTLRSWKNDAKVNGVWTNAAARNAHVHLAGAGWHPLANGETATHQAMLTTLIGAKQADRPVRALIDGRRIAEAYVV